jgi:hypothetical protein
MDVMPEALRLFIICEGMNFTHLPQAGGLYDQHPRLLDRWVTIWVMRGENEEREKAKKAREGRNARKGKM